MNADVRNLKTDAEQALSAAYAAARGSLPGKGALAALREDAFRKFDASGLPHRRVEEWKYTDLRALMRDALSARAAAPDAAARAHAKNAGKLLAGVDCRRLVFVDGAFAPELSDLSPEPGRHHRFDGRGVGQGRPAGRQPMSAGLCDRRCGRGAQHCADGRRRRDPRFRRRCAEAADQSGFCRRQRQAELGFRALAGRGGEGRESHHHRDP